MTKRSILACVLLLVLSPLGGCVEQNVLLEIVSFNVPDPSAGCTVAPDAEVVLSRGSIDAFERSEYIVRPLIRSGIANVERPIGPTNSSINLRWIVVEIQNFAGERIEFTGLPNPFRVSATGFLEPNNSVGNFTEGLASGVAIPGTYLDQLEDEVISAGVTSSEVILKLVVQGETASGQTVRSRSKYLPVEICSGCSPVVCPEADSVICRPAQDGNPVPAAFAECCDNDPATNAPNPDAQCCGVGKNCPPFKSE